MDRIEPNLYNWNGLSESESHTEHEAALEATLFESAGPSRELVLELEAGQLHLRRQDGF